MWDITDNYKSHPTTAAETWDKAFQRISHAQIGKMCLALK